MLAPFTLAVGTLLASAPERVLLDRIVATVNGDIVTLGELQGAAAPYMEQNATPDRRKRLFTDILEQLVNERLISQQIEEANISVSDPEIEAAIEDVLRQNNLSREQLQQALEARGMDMRDYRSDVKDQLTRLKLIDLKVRSRIVIPEEDLRHAYERQMKDEKPTIKVAIAHIQLRLDPAGGAAERERIMAEATELRQRLEQGEDFTELAKAFSQGPTAARGGGLGVLDMEALMPEFQQALRGLEAGQISPPVVAQGGVHIIRLEERQVVPTKSFEELRGQLYQGLYRQKVDEQMKLWLDELRRDSSVTTNLPE